MKELKKEIQTTQWLQYMQNHRSDDLLAMSYLQPLIKDSFLPFSNASMRPHSLVCILNDVLINRRCNILEFGSGISTILLAKLISQYNLGTKVISIDHDKGWIDFIYEFIKKENLDDQFKIIHAPLVGSSKSINNNLWYDENVLNLALPLQFDLVIIDGPMAWDPQKKEARYPAFPFVKDKLADKAAVYLDDAERKGEQLIIQRWEKEFSIKFQIIGGSLAYFIQGEGFSQIAK